MKQKYRDGTEIEKKIVYEGYLGGMYRRLTGRMLLKLLTKPTVSKCAGWALSTRSSRVLVGPFVRRNGIDLSEYEQDRFRSYNEFFSRKIRPENRPIDENPHHLISPCDSQLMVFPVTKDGVFQVKNTPYTVETLLRDGEKAKEYEGGQIMIFRLGVDDYHRDCYVADGEKGENVSIPGVLHTVSPVVYDHFPVYKENAREYCSIDTKEFGEMLMMEVGALMVGKIVNHAQEKAPVQRGMEKGYFQFGGSTVILLVKEGAVQVDEDILRNSKGGYETIVKYGEKIGIATNHT